MKTSAMYIFGLLVLIAGVVASAWQLTQYQVIETGGEYPWLFEGAYAVYYSDKVRLSEDFIRVYGSHMGSEVYFGWNITKVMPEGFEAIVWVSFKAGEDRVTLKESVWVDLETFKVHKDGKLIGNWYLALPPSELSKADIVLFDGLFEKFTVKGYVTELDDAFRPLTKEDFMKSVETLKMGGELPYYLDSRVYKGIDILRDNYLVKEFGLTPSELKYVSMVKSMSDADIEYMKTYTMESGGVAFFTTALTYALIYHEYGILLSGILFPIDSIYYNLFGIYWPEMDRDVREGSWLLLRSSFTLYDTNILP